MYFYDKKLGNVTLQTLKNAEISRDLRREELRKKIKENYKWLSGWFKLKNKPNAQMRKVQIETWKMKDELKNI